jgi:hypothetical protein
MVYTKRFLESATAKRLPEWICTHKAIAGSTRIKKAFPALGLTNCIEDCEHPGVKNAKVVFSSDGFTGLWDLATMSMRGVLSCMHWENHHCSHLIGSILDPVCGIVYITDGKLTNYGLSMIKRALVRVAFRQGEPFLFTDRIYSKTRNTDPMVYENRDRYAAATAGIFRNFLRSKSKLPVYSYGHGLPHIYLFDAFIPEATIISQLGWNEQSLVDCGMPYGRIAGLPRSWRTLID